MICRIEPIPTNNNRSALQRFVLLMLAAFLLFAGLYVAEKILVPIVFAILLAMLLLPVTEKMERWLPRWLAGLISVSILIFVLLSLLSAFTYQLMNIAEDLPRQKEVLHRKMDNLQTTISDITQLSKQQQAILIKQRISNFMDNGADYLKNFFLGASAIFGDLILVLIYTFLFLYSRHRFRNFALWITPVEKQEKLKLIIERSSHITGRYLSGVMIDVAILAVINSTGFLLVGVDYPIFFGVLVAIFNIIPYVGIPIASVFPTLLALLTSDSWLLPLGVIAVISVGQFIDNNFLTPRIVGDKVNLNALTTIIGLLVGAILWGIAGMILFIPLLGVLRIILSTSEDLKPYAYLISSYEETAAKKGPSLLSKLYNKLFRNRKKS